VDSLGVPHLSSEDDMYNGVYIPKGSITIANIWCDPEVDGEDGAQFLTRFLARELKL
jgi:hypothetical protein